MRTASTQVSIEQPAGVKVSKTTATPREEVNPAGATSPTQYKWDIEMANINGPSSLRDPQMVDILPKNGLAGTSFSGTHVPGGATFVATIRCHRPGAAHPSRCPRCWRRRSSWLEQSPAPPTAGGEAAEDLHRERSEQV